jgi:hypothetical protein
MFYFAALASLIVAALLSTGCFKREWTGDDALMVERAKAIGLAINAFHQDTAEWPETIRAAQGYLQPGTSWPDNPYNGRPIEDTGSPEFDLATSVGMVYYEKFYRNDQLMNYQLHVFGDKGKLHIFGNSAFGAKE